MTMTTTIFMYVATRCKDYGILSVLFQLYTKPHICFKIPNTVFYPVPKVGRGGGRKKD